MLNLGKVLHVRRQFTSELYLKHARMVFTRSRSRDTPRGDAPVMPPNAWDRVPQLRDNVTSAQSPVRISRKDLREVSKLRKSETDPGEMSAPAGTCCTMFLVFSIQI